MFLAIITLFVAFILSSIAASYSVIGLMAIFSGASIAIAIMGGTLEISKLLIASWLYRNWNECNKFLKLYLFSSLVILMIITSLGIFGFLSKAHIEQQSGNFVIETQISILDNKILAKQKQIDSQQKIIESMDQAMLKAIDNGSVTRANQIRKEQSEERQTLINEITKIQTEILNIQNERSKVEQQKKSIELKVGPIKYVAELIFGEADEKTLDKSVRYLIMLIVFVFDPLAVALVIAGNISLNKLTKKLETPNNFITVDETGKNWKEESIIFSNNEKKFKF